MTASRPGIRHRRRPSGPRRRTALLLGVCAAGAVLLGAGVSPAAAHEALVSSTPAADSAVGSLPPEVALRFSGPPLPLGTRVVVTGPDGDTASRGSARIRDTAVLQPLAGTGAAGRYTVQWRSTSSDGHPVSGAFAFTVSGDGAAAPVAAAPQPATVAPAEQAGIRSSTVGWAAAGIVALGGLGVLLAARLRGRG